MPAIVLIIYIVCSLFVLSACRLGVVYLYCRLSLDAINMSRLVAHLICIFKSRDIIVSVDGIFFTRDCAQACHSWLVIQVIIKFKLLLWKFG